MRPVRASDIQEWSCRASLLSFTIIIKTNIICKQHIQLLLSCLSSLSLSLIIIINKLYIYIYHDQNKTRKEFALLFFFLLLFLIITIQYINVIIRSDAIRFDSIHMWFRFRFDYPYMTMN